MTLQDFKDQVAREFAKGTIYSWQKWDDMMEDFVSRVLQNHLSDRAATLFAEHERKEAADAGYKEGYTDAYEGRQHKFAVQKDWGDELPY